MPQSFWSHVQTHLDAGPVFIALVAENTKHSPGTAGARLLVAADGTVAGTVGGGIMEYRLIERARAVLDAEAFAPEAVTLHHRKGGPGAKSGMICAGSQTNVYALLRPSTDAAVLDAARARHDAEAGGRLVLTPDGLALDAAPPDFTAPPVVFRRAEDGAWRYEESLLNPRRVAILGGGHCGLALARQMATLGYHVRVFDTRPALGTVGENAAARITVVADFAEAAPQIAHPAQTALVVMTTDVASDVRALLGTAGQAFPFVGVMGSPAKLKRIRADLRAAAFPEADLARIVAPVGLPIGSHTPEEIAVSVAGQLIQIRDEMG